MNPLIINTNGPFGDNRVISIQIENGRIKALILESDGKKLDGENLVVERPVFGYEQHLWDYIVQLGVK